MYTRIHTHTHTQHTHTHSHTHPTPHSLLSCLCFHRGCILINYEVTSLDKAVTIDTQAILQEKHKSYIYLNSTASAEQETIATGTVLSSLLV